MKATIDDSIVIMDLVKALAAAGFVLRAMQDGTFKIVYERR